MGTPLRVRSGLAAMLRRRDPAGPSAACVPGPSYFLIPILRSCVTAGSAGVGTATGLPRSHHGDPICYAAPAIYRANRPQRVHFSVTWDFGGGGMRVGSRSIGPEQDGQLSGEPLRSLAIRCSACAGLYVFGRGLRMNASKESARARPDDPAHRLSLKSNRSWRGPSARPAPERTAAPAQAGGEHGSRTFIPLPVENVPGRVGVRFAGSTGGS